VIGRLLGTAEVGIYSASLEIATLPTNELVLPIARATMPGFAASLREQGDVAGNFLRIIAVAALLTLPAGFGLSMIAGPVVALAFGQGWLDAAPVIAILGFACTVMLFGNVSSALLNARAALRSILGVTIASAVLRVGLLLALTSWFGLFGAACAIGLALALEHLALLGCVLRLLRLSVSRLLVVVWRPALATLVMAGLLWSLGLGWAPPPADAAMSGAMLLRAIPLGAACYGGALLLLWAAAGLPSGAEADLLGVLRRMARRRPSWALNGG
jgi:O-antigen/teichoic acid export membrane protein